ncbi:AsnC family transcriptional regulator [soil metagenome]
MLTHDDMALVDALQIAPRAPWATLGSVLGISAVTAAKRWNALVDEGSAWVTAAPGMAHQNSQVVAYVEITCHPEHRLAVANAIAQHTAALTVELTMGSADLLVTVAASDLQTLSHYLLYHLDQVDHLLSTRTRIATRLYGEGSMWRLRVLDAESVSQLERVRELQMSAEAEREPMPVLSEAAKVMLTHLSEDGRMSLADLAGLADISVSTARRHMSRLLQSGMIILRTDVNAKAVDWPVQVYLWAEVPVDKLSETATNLSHFRSTRLTATVASGTNLVLCCWLRSIEEIHRLEQTIAVRLPHVRVIDRLVVLRQIKRMGRMLDENGNAVGTVPINLWDDLLPHSARTELA